MFRHRKLGAAGVFIIMISVSMIMSGVVIGNAAYKELKDSMCTEALNLASRSVLSEYDLALKDQYRIFAFKGTEDETAEKLEAYLNYNLDQSFTPFNAQNISALVNQTEYSLLECDSLENQLVQAGKFCTIGQKCTKRRKEFIAPGKVIVNPAMISTLPSQGKNLKIINTELFDAGALTADHASDTYFTNRYILANFGSRFSEVTNRYAYLNYETEYILSGKLSEAESLKYVKGRIAAMREVLNAAHILSDYQKMSEIESYIASLPAGKVVATAAIVALWAAAETDNDLLLLLDGKNVAFAKSKMQWAISLKGALGEWLKDGYIEPADKLGEDYDDYLNALLYIEDRETKLVRIMDLIQLNLRTSYNGSLLLKEFYTGFETEVEIDEKRYSYKHTY